MFCIKATNYELKHLYYTANTIKNNKVYETFIQNFQSEFITRTDSCQLQVQSLLKHSPSGK